MDRGADFVLRCGSSLAPPSVEVILETVPGTVTMIEQGNDKSVLRLQAKDGRMFQWSVPNMMLKRLGYEVGSEINLRIGSSGLEGVSPRAA